MKHITKLLRPVAYLVSAAAIILIVRSVFFGMIDLRANCVSRFKMDDNAPDTDVVDSQEYSIGTAQRNTNLLHTDGKVDGALSFNGSDDRIDVNKSYESEFRSSFSINMWVKPDDGRPSNTQIFFMATNPPFNGVAIELVQNTGALYGQYIANGSGDYVSAPCFSDGAETWHMVTFVVTDLSGSVRLTIYFDGEEVASKEVASTMSEYTNPNDIIIGDYGSGNFAGAIDDTMIFDKALSPLEIEFLYNGGEGTKYLTDHYAVYRGQDGNIDYDNPVAEMDYDDTQVTISEQDLPPNTIWHYIRRQVAGCCGKESADSPVCIVQIDADGNMIGSTPNAPNRLVIEKLAGGIFRLRWRYTRLAEEIAPTGFYIYVDSGSGFDFETPDGTVAYNRGGPKAGEFEWTSAAFEHGQLCRFCVRSYRTGAGESQNTNYVSAAADAVGPDAIADLVASYEEI